MLWIAASMDGIDEMFHEGHKLEWDTSCRPATAIRVHKRRWRESCCRQCKLTQTHWARSRRSIQAGSNEQLALYARHRPVRLTLDLWRPLLPPALHSPSVCECISFSLSLPPPRPWFCFFSGSLLVVTVGRFKICRLSDCRIVVALSLCEHLREGE